MKLITFLLIFSSSLCAQTKFAMFGDYGCDEPGELAVANLVKSWNPDFLITLGDNNYYTGNNGDSIDYNIGRYYHDYINPYLGNFGSGSPNVNRFFPILGNHDFYDFTWFSPTDIRYAGHTYYNYFLLTDTCIYKGNTPDVWSPNGVRYYKFKKNNVEFFVINTGASPDNHFPVLYTEPDGVDSNSVQAQWIKNQIRNSTAKWKIVLMHHPPYASLPAGYENIFSVLRWNFRQWGASAVVSGHVHSYESLIINGLPYFICGVGGEDRSTSLSPSYPGSRFQYIANFGALRVTAYTDSLTFKFVNIQNTVIDSYKITTYNNDPGITKVTRNASGNVYTHSVQSFNVRVKNFGGNVLSSVPVYYRVNGGSQIGPVSTGSLSPGDSALVTFWGPRSFIPQTPGNYTLKFYTGLAADPNKFNDTVTMNITVLDSIKDAGTISAVCTNPGTVYSNTNISLKSVVKNFGFVSLPSVPVKLSVNGTPAQTQSSPSLNPGDTAAVPFVLEPSASGVYNYSFVSSVTGDSNNDNDTSKLTLTIIDPNMINLELTVIPQGLFSNASYRLNKSKTMETFLCQAESPYNAVDSASAKIDSITYKGWYRFANVSTGNFYIVAKNKNSLETWSSYPINLSGDFTSAFYYDFSIDSSSAFGNNVIRISTMPQLYAIYCGDMDSDGIIDLTDLNDIYNMITGFPSGNIEEDLNGDGFVDISDMLLVFNNSYDFITKVVP